VQFAARNRDNRFREPLTTINKRHIRNPRIGQHSVDTLRNRICRLSRAQTLFKAGRRNNYIPRHVILTIASKCCAFLLHLQCSEGT
jgi:hypothetical protein